MARLLAHTLIGAKQKTVLFLLHPMGAEKSFWDSFIDLVKNDLCIVVSDQYGAGQSSDITGPLSIDGHVSDMEALRQYLNIDQMIVVGCAIGAMIGARYTELYPSHVSALVMTNPGLRIREAAKKALALRAQSVRAGGMDAIIPSSTDAAFFGYNDDVRKAAYVSQFRSQNAFNYAATLDSVLELDLTETYKRIHCPVLLVPGGQDKLFLADHADEIQALIPHAELELLPHGAHFIPYQYPEDSVTKIKAFMARYKL